jgi:hypothetical protein
MKGLMVFFRVAAVGLVLLAGGRALYHRRVKLKGSWKAAGAVDALKGHAHRLSAGRPVRSAGSLRNLVGQVARFR